MTQFKQKKCPKCGNNHDNEGILCSFCIEKRNIAISKRPQPPPSFWLKCLIEREGGVTVLNVGRIQYTFTPNKFGHSVCEVINQGHYASLLKSDFYEPYSEPEEAETVENIETEQTTDVTADPYWTEADCILMDRLNTEGFKHTQIAMELSQIKGETVSRQRVTKYLQN